MILFINACVRRDSRTKRLADKLITKLDGGIEEVRINNPEFPKVDEEFLIRRDRLIKEGCFDDPSFSLARQFAKADTVVIAAPYWDLSFPAALKQYLELVNVVGITFKYSPEGTPVGLCRAKKLYYVMTAGGNYAPEEFGFGYVKALARGYYGIEDCRLIKALGRDIYGADVEGILQKAEAEIQSL